MQWILDNWPLALLIVEMLAMAGATSQRRLAAKPVSSAKDNRLIFSEASALFGKVSA